MSAPVLKSYEFRREREASWRELETLVDRAERRGVETLSAVELSRLPVLYRAGLSSLSVARAISLDRNVVEYLEALCARAYLCVYGVRHSVGSAIGRFFAHRFPAAFRRQWAVISLSAALLLLGAAAAFSLTVADPDRFHAFVADQYAEGRTPEATTADLRAALYHEENSGERLAAFSAFLFTHNAGIGILSFALGFAAGLPTAILILLNGTILGAFAGLYHGRGLSVEFFAWVLPHGIPELLALVLCGAGGLLVARSLVFPGRMTRIENLAQKGREAGVLVIGAVAFLLVAGIIEGTFRQLVQDLFARWLTAGVIGGSIIAYLSLAGRGER